MRSLIGLSAITGLAVVLPNASKEEIAPPIAKNYRLTVYSLAGDVIPRFVKFSSSFLMNSKSSSGRG